MAGYGYLVSRFLPDNTIEMSRIKIGFFTGNDLENQVHNNYSRSLTPLVIYDYIASHNARWAETTIHIALNKWRINPTHEIFDLSSVEACETFVKVKKIIIDLIEISGLQKPQERTIDYPFWSVAKKAAKVGKKWNKKFVEIEENNKLRESKEKLKIEKQLETERIKKEKKNNKPIDIRKREKEFLKTNETIIIDDFINKNLVSIDDKTLFIKCTPVYEKFLSLHKNTSIKYKHFLVKLIDILGEKCFKKSHGKYHYSNVFFGWKLIDI